MASQAPNGAMAGIVDEIVYQKVLLESIDHTVEDADFAREQVRQEIKKLEKQVKDLKYATYSSTPQSSQPARSQPQISSGRLVQPAADTSVGSMPTGIQAPANASSSASTPNSAGSFPDLLSPSQMTLPSRKRSHSKHLDGGLAPYDDSANKSRRTSHSPFPGSLGTPGDSSSDVELDRMETLMKEREEKYRREKLDEEFARSLQDEGPMQVASKPVRQQISSARPSAFDRMSGARPAAVSKGSTVQTFSENSLARTGKLPPNFLTPGYTNGRTLGLGTSYGNSVKAEPSMASDMTMGFGFKAEPSSGSTGRSSAVQSESKPRIALDESDSDLEIIPPSAFHDNGRRSLGSGPGNLSNHGAGLGGSSVNGVYGNPVKNEALSRAPYGNQSISYPWMDPASSSMNIPSYGQPDASLGVPGQYVFPGESLVDNASGFTMPGSYPMDDPFFLLPSGDLDPGYFDWTNNMRDLEFELNSVNSNPSLNPFVGPSTTFGSPFTDLNKLANGQIGNDIPDVPKEPWTKHMAQQWEYITNDPRKTTEEIQSLLDNIQPDVDLGMENREGTPEGLKYPLYEHQKIALTWLKAQEEGGNKGGILADDMGLGKTISALALILSRPSADHLRKTTLIVGPVALIHQWKREIQKKVNTSHCLRVHMAHGSKRNDWGSLRNFDIVLTTYGTLAAELKRMEKWDLEQKRINGRDYDTAPMRKLFPMLGPKSLFYRVILDEAQCIKNKNTQSARATSNLNSIYRLCLTGTPMMASDDEYPGVGELYSLIHFLRIKPYNDYTKFQAEFRSLTKGDATRFQEKNSLQKLQAVLKAILLRRTKQSKIDGNPIITLPPKSEEIQHVVFTDEEKSLYQALESKTQIQFNRYVKAGTVSKNYSNMLVLLLRLRQCCCHGHLIQDHETVPPIANITPEAMLEMARSLDATVVSRLLEHDGGAFECPVCYDGVENPRIVIPCGHDTCQECLTKISDQSAQTDVINGEEAGGGTKCPSCRGKVDMNKIIDYATFKKAHLPNPNEDGQAQNSDHGKTDDSDSDDSESESDVDDVDGDGDLRDFIVPDEIDEEEHTNASDSTPVLDEESVARGSRVKGKSVVNAEEKKKIARKAKKSKKPKDKKGKGKMKDKATMAELKKASTSSTKARRRYMKFIRAQYEPSAKVTKCVELLDQFMQDNQKTIIFSQFVSLLDILQVPIEERGWGFRHYNGSMSADARNDAINNFTDRSDCKIMLISLKAGNSGLNLVAASRVIILDPFWNPFIEMQAVDRAHRIGQQKPVEVHRILIEQTVEDRIIELQEKKRKLVNAALDEGANQSLGRLGPQELAYLFGVGTRPS
ncbi:SNF2 family N-terminal domain-containing protein [Amylocarpus encephaloides]|uniref:SNF2 family N-terminal domain-containing protein n=1 Tax=Amylocarpus encephaloides TaxID=45428 RepID=A0A9P7YDX6_9HELO|nr:SNF2 family N-terminal domain-containing protein [Amylocarpus encephaloides]